MARPEQRSCLAAAVLCVALCTVPRAAAGAELVEAFIFGSRTLACEVLTGAGGNYTVVYHGTPDDLKYGAGRGWGYEVLHGPDDYPYGLRAGYGIFGPFDDSPNSRNQFPNTCPEEIFDSFIGAKNFLQVCDATTVGDTTTPCAEGGLTPEGIIFRVDVPNGLYRFVAAAGSADNRHVTRLVAEDGGDGLPEWIGPDHVVLVANHDQAEHGTGVFAWVGFDTFTAPPLSGPTFIHMDADGRETAGAPESPVLEVTQGYIRIHQLQGNSNAGAAGAGDPNGGNIVLLELWKVADPGPDTTPPVMSSISPPAGKTVRDLTTIAVTFSENVVGVNAADLLVASFPAASVTGAGRGPYVFSFPPPGIGVIDVGWAAGHGISDTAPEPNAFAGGAWSYTIDPWLPPDSVVINEILASNATGLRDEDGDAGDWIELLNRGAHPADLEGWSLTDNPDLKAKWVFPAVTLDPGEFLVVFASGKDRAPTAGGNLHTNFKLDRNGEYLGLFDAQGNEIMGFTPAYPPQRQDYSWGLAAGDALAYFLVPTPGAANSAQTAVGLVSAPVFTPEHGVYENAIDVSLSTPTEGAVIRYRMDPERRALTPTGGVEYTGPITISGRTGLAVVTVRAIAVKPDHIPSNVVTASYVFPEHVLRQPRTPEGGWPSTWYNRFHNSSIPADYAMDPNVVNNTAAGYHAMAYEALKEVPSVMVSMDIDDLFGTDGIYANATQDCLSGQGADCPWERVCSVEMLYPGGRKGFQVDCGIRMQGGTSRRSVWKVPKLSFRLVFRDRYGPTKLTFPVFPDSPVQRFDTLVLDAKMNMTWIHASSSQHGYAQYVRELFCDDTQNAMGGSAAHNIVVNLYVNGLHWGLYNLHERTDDSFAESYHGGSKADYNVLKHRTSNVINPNPPLQSRATTAWNTMFALIQSTPVANERLLQVWNHLDIPGLCDYMIMNQYVGNSDWAHQNWYATHHNDGGVWRFHSWDAEHVLKVNEVTRSVHSFNVGGPTDLYNRLRTNSEFRLIFADHLHRHFFNGGLLYIDPDNPGWNPEHPERNRPAASYMRRIDEYWKIIVIESARWGDYRKTPAYTHADWLHELNRLLTNYFPHRSRNVINEFRSLGLYPALDAPVFQRHGGMVNAGFNLQMARTPGTPGTIYYTTDGSDPRVFGTGTVSANAVAYTAPLTIQTTTHVAARVRSGTTWSALNEAVFTVLQPLDALRVTEVMYHPPASDAYDGASFEFIELKNTGSSVLDLTGTAFIEGIAYEFPEGAVLPPGAFAVVAGNVDAFRSRYPAVTPFGPYRGRLDNDFDTVTLRDPEQRVLVSFTYGNGGWWPRAAGGEGHSLVAVDPAGSGDLSHPDSWTASASYLGSPGHDDSVSVPTTPQIISQPADVLVQQGDSAVFSIQAWGYPELSYRWQRNGVDIPGASDPTYTIPSVELADSGALLRCVVSNTAGSVTSREALLGVVTSLTPFRRGDVNADGKVDISDAVAVLRVLFSGDAPVACEKAADINDDGTLNIADGIALLAHLFAGGAPPPPPFETCGWDLTPDALGCDTFPPCAQ